MRRLDAELKPFGDLPADAFLPVDSGLILVGAAIGAVFADAVHGVMPRTD
ncbi:hypothetical protein [Streptomyces mirabilis]